MVRVKSEAYTKASVKAPRKQTALKGDSSKTPKNGKSSKYSGGNAYCLRSTPNWQKPITSFFGKNWSQDEAADENTPEMDIAACSSASTACSSASAACSSASAACSSESAACSSESAACSSASLSDPVPGCSKDDSDQVETVKESEHVTDEEESVPEVKSSEEQVCSTNGSGECESGSNV